MSLKVLVIDDEISDQTLIKRCLQKDDRHEVFLSDNGEDGLKRAIEIRPDIIVTDTRLPGIDGFEICRRVKASQEIDSKIIIVTGLIDAIDASKAAEAGADEYCVKTSDCQHILAAIEKIL